MPSNLFGPNDNYNSNNSHFFAAFIKKLYLGRIQKREKILFWGTGRSKRELTFVDDVAEACLFFLKKKTKDVLINIGSGFELSIKQYADYVAKIIGCESQIIFDGNRKMDGTKRKLVNCALAKKYGWKSKFSFSSGFKITFQDFLENKKKYLAM
jgi:GDP-L-fucose synthase